MRHRHSNFVPLLLMAALSVQPAAADAQVAQEAVDMGVVQQIREEGLER
jgi:predicted type IV restriction endonuclease